MAQGASVFLGFAVLVFDFQSAVPKNADSISCRGRSRKGAKNGAWARPLPGRLVVRPNKRGASCCRLCPVPVRGAFMPWASLPS